MIDKNLSKEIEEYKKSNLFDPLNSEIDPQGDPQGDPQEKTMEQIILEVIRTNNKVTREELAEITNSSVSTIKRRLKMMADKVVYVGSGYSGHWKIKE